MTMVTPTTIDSERDTNRTSRSHRKDVVMWTSDFRV